MIINVITYLHLFSDMREIRPRRFYCKRSAVCSSVLSNHQDDSSDSDNGWFSRPFRVNCDIIIPATPVTSGDDSHLSAGDCLDSEGLYMY